MSGKPSQSVSEQPNGKVPRWTYSHFRASLYLDGKQFAIVTPDGNESLTKEDAETLLAALNRETSK